MKKKNQTGLTIMMEEEDQLEEEQEEEAGEITNQVF
jgi:hypothetical protein